MQTEDTYQDLTELFESQDASLRSEEFVDTVMQPIRRRSRWRGPLLFGAGGIGVGATLSQLGGLLDMLKTSSPDLNLRLNDIPAMSFEGGVANPLLLAIAVMIAFGCAAIVLAERA